MSWCGVPSARAVRGAHTTRPRRSAASQPMQPKHQNGQSNVLVYNTRDRKTRTVRQICNWVGVGSGQKAGVGSARHDTHFDNVPLTSQRAARAAVKRYREPIICSDTGLNAGASKLRGWAGSWGGAGAARLQGLVPSWSQQQKNASPGSDKAQNRLVLLLRDRIHRPAAPAGLGARVHAPLEHEGERHDGGRGVEDVLQSRPTSKVLPVPPDDAPGALATGIAIPVGPGLLERAGARCSLEEEVRIYSSGTRGRRTAPPPSHLA